MFCSVAARQDTARGHWCGAVQLPAAAGQDADAAGEGSRELCPHQPDSASGRGAAAEAADNSRRRRALDIPGAAQGSVSIPILPRLAALCVHGINHCIPLSVPSGAKSAQHLKGIKSCTLLLHCRAVSNVTRTCLSQAGCISHKEPAHSLLSASVCIAPNYTHREAVQPAPCHDALQVEKVQSELDGLAATLKQVELYNEQMKGEIAVTRR